MYVPYCSIVCAFFVFGTAIEVTERNDSIERISTAEGDNAMVHHPDEQIQKQAQAFYAAIDGEDYYAVRSLLSAGADPNVFFADGQTPLTKASRRNLPAVVHILLLAGAGIDMKDKEKSASALIWASIGGYLDVVKHLVEAGANVDITDDRLWTPLMYAVNGNHPTVVRYLLQNRANPNMRNKQGVTALALACEGGQVDVVSKLLEANADLHIPTYDKDDGWTPLMYAVRNGSLAIVDKLIIAGADVNASSPRGATALILASVYNFVNIVRRLHESHAHLDAYTKSGTTALMYACDWNSTAVAEYLIGMKCALDMRDKDGMTALMLSSAAGKAYYVELLLRAGANASMELNGSTALEMARSRNHTNVEKIFLSVSSDYRVDATPHVGVSNKTPFVFMTMASSSVIVLFTMWVLNLRNARVAESSDRALEVEKQIQDNADVGVAANEQQILNQEDVAAEQNVNEPQMEEDAVVNADDIDEVEVEEQIDDNADVDIAVNEQEMPSQEAAANNTMDGVVIMNHNDIEIAHESLKISLYSRVYRARYRGSTNVVIKMLHNSANSSRQQLTSELDILSKLRHPRVLMLLGIVNNLDAKYGADVGLVTEYMSRGSLYDVLHDTSTPLEHRLISLPSKLRVLKDVADGMRFLHECRVIHRDLKSPNILLDEDGRAKICDFGVSRCLPADTSYATSVAGSARWKSPEALLGEGVTRATDAYSFGVVMWEMLTNQIPWGNRTEADIGSSIERGQGLPLPVPTDDCPQVLIDILEMCLLRIQVNRPSFEMLFQDLHSILLAQGPDCPQEYICPISYEIMVDPVICAEGYTYERASIERAFQSCNRSPLTNIELHDKSLRPNRALKSLIDDFRRSATM